MLNIVIDVSIIFQDKIIGKVRSGQIKVIMSSIVTSRVKFIDTSIIFQDKITGKVRSGQIKVVMSSIDTGRVKHFIPGKVSSQE